MQKMNLDTVLAHFTKCNSKCIMEFIVKPRTIKLFWSVSSLSSMMLLARKTYVHLPGAFSEPHRHFYFKAHVAAGLALVILTVIRDPQQYPPGNF